MHSKLIVSNLHMEY